MKKAKILLLLMILFLLSGCISIKSSRDKSDKQAQSEGGIYKSADYGQVWNTASSIASVTDEKPNFGHLSISSFAIDPQDHDAIYVGSETNGLFYSYDRAQSWQQSKTFTQGRVDSIAVHPKNKCIVFISSGNGIFKSVDCSRTWERVYFDTRTRSLITSLTIDWFDPLVLYAGTSDGDVLQSKDGGLGWTTLLRTDSNVVKIIIGADTRFIFVGTEYQGLFVSTDKGKTWKQRYEEIKKIGTPEELKDLVIDYKNNVLIITTKHGLLRSATIGETWEDIPLLTPERGVVINKLGVNPGNHQELYYVTSVAFFKTADGGKTWSSSQLPTPSIPTILRVHPSAHSTVFLGFKKIEKE